MITRETLRGYLQGGLSIPAIATKVGQSSQWVRQEMRRHKLGALKSLRPHPHSDEWKERLEAHVAAGRTVDKIGEIEGLLRCTVIAHMRYHKLKSKKRLKQENDARLKASIDWAFVERRLIDDGIPYRTLADQLGMNRTVFTAMCHERNLRSAKVERETYIESIDRAFLEELVNDGLHASAIACLLDIRSVSSVQRLLAKHGLTAPNPVLPGWTGTTVSFPCEHLKEQLRAYGFSFDEEYLPLRSRKYRIDIAFPAQKVGIEVNGGFHYTDRTKEILTLRHQIRHDLICDEGWNLIEVFYKRVWDEAYVQQLAIQLHAMIGLGFKCEAMSGL